MEKVTIVHVIKSTRAHNGGTSTAVIALAKALTVQAVENVIVSRDCVESMKYDEESKVKLGVTHNPSSLLIISMIKECISLLDSKTKTHWHFHGVWCWELWIIMLLLVVKGRGFFLSPHGMVSKESFLISAVKKKIVWHIFLKRLIRVADRVIVNSEIEKDEFLRCVYHSNVSVVPHPLNVNFRQAEVLASKIAGKQSECINQEDRSANINLLFLGRVSRIKNIELCIKLTEKLQPRASLVIAGPEDRQYGLELRKLVYECGLVSKVSFVGFVDEEGKKSLFAQADYLVLLSKRENFGIVVPESIVHGVPVIVGKNTPWKSVEDYGLGICTNNIEEIVSYILALKKSCPVETELFRRNSFLFLSKFTELEVRNKYMQTMHNT